MQFFVPPSFSNKSLLFVCLFGIHAKYRNKVIVPCPLNLIKILLQLDIIPLEYARPRRLYCSIALCQCTAEAAAVPEQLLSCHLAKFEYSANIKLEETCGTKQIYSHIELDKIFQDIADIS